MGFLLPPPLSARLLTPRHLIPTISTLARDRPSCFTAGQPPTSLSLKKPRSTNLVQFLAPVACSFIYPVPAMNVDTHLESNGLLVHK